MNQARVILALVHGFSFQKAFRIGQRHQARIEV